MQIAMKPTYGSAEGRSVMDMETPFHLQQVDGSISCSNVVFGDPLPLQAKECQCKQASQPSDEAVATTGAPTTEVTWERCAGKHDGHATHADCNETAICPCRGEVRYGHGDTWPPPNKWMEALTAHMSVLAILRDSKQRNATVKRHLNLRTRACPLSYVANGAWWMDVRQATRGSTLPTSCNLS